MSSNFKYISMVLELPAMMLILGYAGQWLDESYAWFGGYGMVVGIVLALVTWIYRASYLLNRSDNE